MSADSKYGSQILYGMFERANDLLIRVIGDLNTGDPLPLCLEVEIVTYLRELMEADSVSSPRS